MPPSYFVQALAMSVLLTDPAEYQEQSRSRIRTLKWQETRLRREWIYATNAPADHTEEIRA